MTVDKFGHYKHFHGAGDQGAGSSVGRLEQDRSGNYDMKYKRITKVGDGQDEDDAASMKHIKTLANQVDSHRVLLKNAVDNLPSTVNVTFSKYTKEVVEKKIDDLRSSLETTIKTKTDENSDIASSLKKVERDWKAELKAAALVIRHHISKVTASGHKRLTKDEEKNIREKAREPESTWRDVFPELEKKKES